MTLITGPAAALHLEIHALRSDLRESEAEAEKLRRQVEQLRAAVAYRDGELAALRVMLTHWPVMPPAEAEGEVLH